MHSVAVARNAMATRFEIVLHGEKEVSLRAAAEEALDEIERLDGRLSVYNPASDVSHINARASRGPVRIEPTLFQLLQRAQELSRETDGAFDVTVAPLMRCWGFVRGTGTLPTSAEVAEARASVGMHLVELDPRDFTVQFAHEGVMLDLGSIAKGYALERALEVLKEAGVSSGFLHGGTSTVCALGTPPDAAAWKVGVPHPEFAARMSPCTADGLRGASESEKLLAVVPLKDEAMSVSAVWGKSFEAGGRVYGHVIDPRRGEPTDAALLAVVVLPSATETDALSTALLVEGVSGWERMTRVRAGARMLMVSPGETPGRFLVKASQIPLLEAVPGEPSTGRFLVQN
jgi:FAD:protein FMN transferase